MLLTLRVGAALLSLLFGERAGDGRTGSAHEATVDGSEDRGWEDTEDTLSSGNGACRGVGFVVTPGAHLRRGNPWC